MLISSINNLRSVVVGSLLTAFTLAMTPLTVPNKYIIISLPLLFRCGSRDKRQGQVAFSWLDQLDQLQAVMVDAFAVDVAVKNLAVERTDSMPSVKSV